MQVHSERRSGAERRQDTRYSTPAPGPDLRGYGAALGIGAAGGDDAYDPYDPYWEPVKGQDDD